MQQPEPQPVAKAAPEAPAEVDNSGWLRDVLRNATAKQQSTQTQPSGLSGLTEEIARSIDDGALADAWARYQSGESNVFSRRIYTLAGQGTYDDVRKKLQREPDFARTAQAYMSEFEQLLKRAAAGANPAGETREYLLSDLSYPTSIYHLTVLDREYADNTAKFSCGFFDLLNIGFPRDKLTTLVAPGLKYI